MQHTLLVALLSLVNLTFLEPAQENQKVQDFELPGLDGSLYRLSDQEGRIVVLEWTSHLCPSVAKVTETRLMADTRSAVDALVRAHGKSDGSVWWQVDSSWFAPELAGDARDWRGRSGYEGPLLLDSTGEVGRALGVLATPQLVVIGPQGELAYSGPLDSGDEEDGRINHVVETVRAILEGEPAPLESVSLRGCTIKFRRPPGMAARDWGSGQEANDAYRRAALALTDGTSDPIEQLERAFREGLPHPGRVLTDPAFRSLLAESEPRARVRDLLRAHPAQASLAMVAADEPGEPLVLAGRVVDDRGEPIVGAHISIYHTDDAGWYSPGSLSGTNARLFCHLMTDHNGRFRVRTIAPGHYSGFGGPAHIHFKVEADGYFLPAGQRTSLFFEGDPNLSVRSRQKLLDDGYPVLETFPNAEGVPFLVHEVKLHRR